MIAVIFEVEPHPDRKDDYLREAARLKPILEAGRDARLLRFDSSEDAYRTFFGLVVRDVQIRLLLGDETLRKTNIEADAKAATEQFFALYGRG